MKEPVTITLHGPFKNAVSPPYSVTAVAKLVHGERAMTSFTNPTRAAADTAAANGAALNVMPIPVPSANKAKWSLPNESGSANVSL